MAYYNLTNVRQEAGDSNLKSGVGKPILIGAAIFLAALFLGAGFREFVWSLFSPASIVGDTVDCMSDDLETISRKWFEEYFSDLEGWTVPYNYRIEKAEITSAEILTDLEEPYIQLDYQVYAASANNGVMYNLELMQTNERRVYTGQMVLRWEQTDWNTWQIAEKLRPVQYQIMTPEYQEEANMPQTQHYKFQSDKEMTYYIQDETLYVTYDGGETFQEVPDGYEKVCKETNDTYDELLDDNSYIVTEEFTGFIGYTDQGTELIYSEDQGGTWQESLITENGYKAASFLSRQNGVCYVTFATDRALGSDYYGSWWSEDLNTWTYITTGDMPLSNLTCVYWASDGTGYYARGELLYRMAGREGGLEELTWPEAVEVTESLGFNPFDSIDRFYEEDGVLYMVVGQGSDGDYVKDGKLSEVLYQSADGVTFTFVKEIADDTPEEAG